MSDPQMRTVAEDGPGRLRTIVTSAILVAFTVGVGLTCVLVLSCTLTQGRLSRIAIDGVPVSIWKLDDVRKQWSDLREQIFEQADSLSVAETDLSRDEKSLADNDTRYRPQRTQLDAELEEFNFRVRPFDETLAKIMSGQSPAEQVGRANAAKDELSAHPDVLQLLDQINKTYGGYEPVYQDRMKVQAALQADRARVAKLQERLVALRASVDRLFGQFSRQTLDEPTRARVENALFELYSAGWLGRLINKLMVTPPDILTLGLVVLMGILGSALQMTHSLFKEHRVEGPGAYFLRLSVGAITALVIFIVAKAGVPVIADASQLGGDAPINPYFVSFLAIISGLTSENAIVSVERQGERFFAQDGSTDQPRWARYDLHQAFQAAGREPDAVRRLLDADSSQFEDWLSGKQPMASSAQTMLAGVLGLRLRDLFTDIAPDDTIATAAQSRNPPETERHDKAAS